MATGPFIIALIRELKIQSGSAARQPERGLRCHHRMRALREFGGHTASSDRSQGGVHISHVDLLPLRSTEVNLRKDH